MNEQLEAEWFSVAPDMNYTDWLAEQVISLRMGRDYNYNAGVAAAVAVCRERAKQWEEMPDFGSLAVSVKFHLQAESKSCADAIEQLAARSQDPAAGDGETR